MSATHPPAQPAAGDSLSAELQARFNIVTPPGSPQVPGSDAPLATISLDGDAAPPATSGADAGAAPAAALPTSSRAHSSSGGRGLAPPAAAAPAPPPAVSHAPPPAGSVVKVVVKDAEKSHERSRLMPFSHTITCLVRTECASDCALACSAASAAATGGHQQHSTFEVRRRFEDFPALAGLLRSHFKGYFLPALPASDWLSAGDAFMKQRRADLQHYLHLVANHPVLQASEELLLFLTAPGELASCARWQEMLQRPAPFEALLAPLRGAGGGAAAAAAAAAAAGGGGEGAAAAPAAGGGGEQAASAASSSSAASAAGGMGSMMMLRMKASLRSAVGGLQQQAPAQQAELPADELQLQQAKDWLKEMQQHLSVCVQAVRSLTGGLGDVAEHYGELGRALSHFARQQEAVASKQGQYTTCGATAVQRGADLQRAGYGALRQQSLSKQLVVAAGASLVFLPDWQALIPECVAALQEREDALAGMQLLAGELREKQAAAATLAAALGPAAPGDKRLAALNSAVAAQQHKLLAADRQYQTLKERNHGELVRLNLQAAADFRRALGRFAAVSAQVAAAAAEVWAGVAEQFADASQEAQQQQS